MPNELTVEELQAELEKAQGALKRANAESAGRRKDLEKYAEKEKSQAEANLSETEKLKAKIATIDAAHQKLEDKLRAQGIREAITLAATKLGFAAPGDAYALTDRSEVVTDKAGKVTGFEKSLAALAESGRLTMNKQLGDGYGTPPSGGKKPKVKLGADGKPVQQEAPNINL